MHNLKNCPFCGGEAYINAYTYDGHINYDHETVYTVKCTNHKCRLQSIEAVTKDGEVSHEDAIFRVTSLWNARCYDADTDNKIKRSTRLKSKGEKNKEGLIQWLLRK